jgi:hypothetical protein
MRVVGLNVSRTVAEIACLENGEVKPGGRVELVHSVLARWGATQLHATDHVVLEATGNTTAVVHAAHPLAFRWRIFSFRGFLLGRQVGDDALQPAGRLFLHRDLARYQVRLAAGEARVTPFRDLRDD